ncbi:transcription termination/antitermination protein NusG [Aestuariivirga sp.]|uniref:transcription termination/antitermination protein NusG n=1 Tax=Aestuariivirga sp. TaxID=2650926 RepID=UPI003BAD7989
MSYNIGNQAEPHVVRGGGQHAGWAPDIERESAARWFAVNTLPSAEKRAHVNLVRQGWHCFCPLVSRTIRSGRHLLTQPRPLFPSYLFLRLDPQQCRWRSVDGTYGVRAIVKSGDLPAPLPAGCIETLIKMSDDDGKVTFASSLVAGENVRFLAGPFAGFIGQLEHLDPYGRITVLLELLGRATRISAAASEVLPADAANTI